MWGTLFGRTVLNTLIMCPHVVKKTLPWSSSSKFLAHAAVYSLRKLKNSKEKSLSRERWRVYNRKIYGYFAGNRNTLTYEKGALKIAYRGTPARYILIIDTWMRLAHGATVQRLWDVSDVCLRTTTRCLQSCLRHLPTRRDWLLPGTSSRIIICVDCGRPCPME